MEVFHSFEEMHNCPRSVIALGTFDGVHLGHQMVMAKAREIAQDMNASSAVVTFAAHPLSILCPEKEPLRLATVKQKIRYIADQGIDILVLLAMTKELINESPEDFCRQLLRYVHPCAIVVGSNFTYGAKARGNTDTLKQFMQTQGIPVHVLTLLDRPAGIRQSAVPSSVSSSHWATWKRRQPSWDGRMNWKRPSYKAIGVVIPSAFRRRICLSLFTWRCRQTVSMLQKSASTDNGIQP